MIIGVPREIKKEEYRVAMTPSGVYSLTQAGHKVLIETKAGLGSGISDDDYIAAGAEIVPTADEVFEKADMIVKVKEPQEVEIPKLRENQVLFTYLHLAADKKLTEKLLERKIIGIAYETVELDDGSLPLLIPMSEVAGRMAPQEGAKYLEKPQKGLGVLLGGIPGVPPAEVVIIGGGTVGTNAAFIAAGMGADVTVLDLNPVRLRYLAEIMPANVKTLISTPYNVKEALKKADLVIGAVLIHGRKAPKIITREMLKEMKDGAVIVDVAIDQGGIAETSKPTTHTDPIFIEEGVVHYCVANMPGAVPRTSTYGLTNSTLPYVLELANKGWKRAVKEDKSLWRGVNVFKGYLVYKGIAEDFNMPYTPLEEVIDQ